MFSAFNSNWQGLTQNYLPFYNVSRDLWSSSFRSNRKYVSTRLMLLNLFIYCISSGIVIKCLVQSRALVYYWISHVGDLFFVRLSLFVVSVSEFNTGLRLRCHRNSVIGHGFQYYDIWDFHTNSLQSPIVISTRNSNYAHIFTTHCNQWNPIEYNLWMSIKPPCRSWHFGILLQVFQSCPSTYGLLIRNSSPNTVYFNRILKIISVPLAI